MSYKSKFKIQKSKVKFFQKSKVQFYIIKFLMNFKNVLQTIKIVMILFRNLGPSK
jgi:hypothetical protein